MVSGRDTSQAGGRNTDQQPAAGSFKAAAAAAASGNLQQLLSLQQLNIFSHFLDFHNLFQNVSKILGEDWVQVDIKVICGQEERQ